MDFPVPLFSLPFSLFLLPLSLVILAIDPGLDKCGVVAADNASILERAVVPVAAFPHVLRDWTRRHRISQVVLGDRTGRDKILKQIATELPGIAVAVVGETNTTLLARRRYFAEHPPRGWRRLLPASMQVPPEPYDDYAAMIILERFVEQKR